MTVMWEAKSDISLTSFILKPLKVAPKKYQSRIPPPPLNFNSFPGSVFILFSFFLNGPVRKLVQPASWLTRWGLYTLRGIMSEMGASNLHFLFTPATVKGTVLNPMPSFLFSKHAIFVHIKSRHLTSIWIPLLPQGLGPVADILPTPYQETSPKSRGRSVGYFIQFTSVHITIK